MHAATEEPSGLSGFIGVQVAGIEVFFRPRAGRFPEVLEIGLRRRRRPRIEAYWDGLRVALSARGGRTPWAPRPGRPPCGRRTGGP